MLLLWRVLETTHELSIDGGHGSHEQSVIRGLCLNVAWLVDPSLRSIVPASEAMSLHSKEGKRLTYTLETFAGHLLFQAITILRTPYCQLLCNQSCDVTDYFQSG